MSWVATDGDTGDFQPADLVARVGLDRGHGAIEPPDLGTGHRQDILAQGRERCLPVALEQRSAKLFFQLFQRHGDRRRRPADLLGRILDIAEVGDLQEDAKLSECQGHGAHRFNQPEICNRNFGLIEVPSSRKLAASFVHPTSSDRLSQRD